MVPGQNQPADRYPVGWTRNFVTMYVAPRARLAPIRSRQSHGGNRESNTAEPR